MSCVCILAPVVVASWPAFSMAVVSAATSLGYTLAEGALAYDKNRQKSRVKNQIELQIDQSELVTGSLSRDQRIRVVRGNVTVTFSRDARGKASLCVEGEGHTDEALRAMGEELSKRVVQRYVYQRIMDEMRARQFMVVEEQTEENQAIRLKVRRWEN
ncbi:MAG TPA: DUF1257 domain-containing protein [Candidatus Paceibacterota bacterium]|nr:DUF1257 domain-containing protein [Verrucomicrobiota bacterium]HRY49071.1 DUF1257 domain-containing protein [Candidatus Paceibacterota bacterium]